MDSWQTIAWILPPKCLLLRALDFSFSAGGGVNRGLAAVYKHLANLRAMDHHVSADGITPSVVLNDCGSHPWLQKSFTGTRTTENPIFTAVFGQAAFQVEKPLDARKMKNVIFRYAYQQTALSNLLIPGLVLPQDQHVRTSTVSGELLRDSRDNPYNATQHVSVLVLRDENGRYALDVRIRKSF